MDGRVNPLMDRKVAEALSFSLFLFLALFVYSKVFLASTRASRRSQVHFFGNLLPSKSASCGVRFFFRPARWLRTRRFTFNLVSTDSLFLSLSLSSDSFSSLVLVSAVAASVHKSEGSLTFKLPRQDKIIKEDFSNLLMKQIP